MKKSWIILMGLFFSFFSSYYLGCNKTDHPFGVYAPYGLDVPTLTATPLAGAINVFVIENNNAVAGVTVDLKDPNGNYLPNVVTGTGAGAYAAFSPFPVTTGTWLAEVYTQGHYLDATQSFMVTGGQTSVTFTAGTVGTTSPSFTSGPLNQQYQTGNGTFAYGVTYSQPGNLSIPVSVRLLNTLPTGFASSPSTFVLGLSGTGADQSPVTISKTACYRLSVPVTFSAFNFFDNSFFASTAFNVTRGFQVLLSVSVNGTASYSNPLTSYNFTVNLTANNDCNYSYPVSIWGVASNVFGNPQTLFANSVSLLNGGSYVGSFGISSAGSPRVNNGIIYVKVTSPIGSTMGSVGTSSSFSGTAVSTSY